MFPLSLLNTKRDVLSVYYGSTPTQRVTQSRFLMPVFCFFSVCVTAFTHAFLVFLYDWFKMCVPQKWCGLCQDAYRSCCCWVTHFWMSESLHWHEIYKDTAKPSFDYFRPFHWWDSPRNSQIWDLVPPVTWIFCTLTTYLTSLSLWCQWKQFVCKGSPIQWAVQKGTTVLRRSDVNEEVVWSRSAPHYPCLNSARPHEHVNTCRSQHGTNQLWFGSHWPVAPQNTILEQRNPPKTGCYGSATATPVL